MRKLFLLFLTLSIALTACTQKKMNNTDKESPWIILPSGVESKLCKIENNKIVEVETIKFPSANYKYSIDINGWVAGFTTIVSPYKILLAKIDQAGKIEYHNNIAVPSSLRPKCVVVYNGRIFVGGSSATDTMQLLMVYNIEKKEWKSIEMPAEIKSIFKSQKAIDDILIQEDKLIAVDNIVFPKYLIEYNIANPDKPLLIKTYRLSNNGPYEHITKGSMNDQYLALFSSSSSIYGYTKVVNVFNVGDYSKYIYFSVKKMHQEEKNKQQEWKEWNDILLCNNTVYIAAGLDGIGFISFTKKDIQNGSPFNGKNVQYYKIPKAEVYQLLKMPFTEDYLIALLVTDKGLNYKLLNTKEINTTKK